MAEDTGQSRVIPATPRRREEALKQGQVAFSPDLAGSLLLLVGVGALYYLGPGIGKQFLGLLRSDLMRPEHAGLGAADAGELLRLCYSRFLLFVGTLLGILVVAGIAVSILQVGFHILPERLEANFERLSPARNAGRLFSTAALVKGFFAILKLVLLAAVAYFVLRSRVGAILSLGEAGVHQAVATGWGVIIRLAFVVACVFVALGVADFTYQKVRFEQGLMMTVEEYKEEMKNEEGDPEVRGRIRQIARERAIQRMLAEVPRATAVVTNPTHYAVALYFNRDQTPVPVVIAKGTGTLALRIKAIAQRHGVPVLERKELARALYGMVEVNQTIPLELFYAVAEVIAFVEKLRRGVA